MSSKILESKINKKSDHNCKCGPNCTCGDNCQCGSTPKCISEKALNVSLEMEKEMPDDSRAIHIIKEPSLASAGKPAHAQVATGTAAFVTPSGKVVERPCIPEAHHEVDQAELDETAKMCPGGAAHDPASSILKHDGLGMDHRTKDNHSSASKESESPQEKTESPKEKTESPKVGENGKTCTAAIHGEGESGEYSTDNRNTSPEKTKEKASSSKSNSAKSKGSATEEFKEDAPKRSKHL